MLRRDELDSLLAQTDVLDGPVSIKLISSGGNNQTYEISSPKKSLIAKYYFRHQDDQRDRLTSEYLFLQHCKNHAPSWTPAPLGVDFGKGIALHEFIDGARIEKKDISSNLVNHAAEFFVDLNQFNSRVRGTNLPVASEACFSIKGHIELVQNRIINLKNNIILDKEEPSIKLLISELCSEITNLSNEIDKKSRTYGLEYSALLANENRCISPSDFGFHNAILKQDGSIKFIDFEYAGWDDPAKMVGDFFSQLAIPVPESFFEFFLSEVMKPFDDPQALMLRARLLRTVYKIKWCCIALNIFLPVNLMRRKHSNPNLNEKELKKIQISKAEAILAEIRKTKHVVC